MPWKRKRLSFCLRVVARWWELRLVPKMYWQVDPFVRLVAFHVRRLSYPVENADDPKRLSHKHNRPCQKWYRCRKKVEVHRSATWCQISASLRTEPRTLFLRLKVERSGLVKECTHIKHSFTDRANMIPFFAIRLHEPPCIYNRPGNGLGSK